MKYRTWMYLAVTAVLPVLILGQGCPFAPPPPPDDPTVPGDSGITGQFAGSSRCVVCHARVHQNWSDTLHAGALETLEAIGQDQNPACVGCHTVGFGEDGGFVNRATTNDLAGVGCESCHGPSHEHVRNVTDRSVRPPVDIGAEVCGQCHNGSHHPHIEEWSESGHATITPGPAAAFTDGRNLNNCGACHSGDFFYLSRLQGLEVPDTLLAGLTTEEMTPITCTICHDPHGRRGNAAAPDPGRDFQLRFPEVANPTPTDTVAAATNPARFNICGQCHHSRGVTWEATARGPHYSVQSNVYVGEMPVPDGTPSLVTFGRRSVHARATEQCATCHMYRQDFQSEIAPAISGHTFRINTASCGTAGCHITTDDALTAMTALRNEVETRLANLKNRLGDPSTWQYSTAGGPQDQSGLSDEIKQVRFLIHYTEQDRSYGMHNPNYVREMLRVAEELLNTAGL